MKSCSHCGSRLPIPRRSDARFCSGACRVAAHRAGGLPAQLRESDRWVRYRLVRRGDRVTKPPIQCDGRAAKSTDPSTWSSYADAKRSTAGDGLGFALGAGFACIDIDGCLTGGVPDDRAVRLLELNPDAYVETSPSGTGLHIWGTAPEGPGRTRSDFEFYSAGRYITVTGNVFRKGVLAPLSV